MSRVDKTKDIGIAADRHDNDEHGEQIAEARCCDGDACSWENTSKRSVEETEG